MSTKAAIMFADIVGSTQLYESFGDLSATDCVNRCIQKMTRTAQHFGGVIVKTVGDEIMCRFETADNALKACVALHEHFSTNLDEKLETTISLRIGVHFGEIIERDDDLFGDTVNIAARMVSISTANQIITTEDTVNELSDEWLGKTRLFDRIEIKGKLACMVIHEVIWEERNMTVIRTFPGEMAIDKGLHFIYQETEVQLNQNSPPFVLGRSPASDLLIRAPLVSRTHAYCLYRRGKFIFIDQSTNGSFVKVDGGQEIYLRREEIPLVGQGVIALGESSAKDNRQIIRYITDVAHKPVNPYVAR